MVLDFIICDGLNSLHFFAVSTDIQTTSCPTNPSLDQFILISNGMEMHEVRIYCPLKIIQFQWFFQSNFDDTYSPPDPYLLLLVTTFRP